MALIDMHCHLDLFPKPNEIVQECLSRGMYVLAVTTLPSIYARSSNFTKGRRRMRTALGFHPELVAGRLYEIQVFEDLVDATEYIGEIGLDGSQKNRHTLGVQEDTLSHILGLCCRQRKKAISLHSRGAVQPLLNLIEKHSHAGRFLLHWFSASKSEIQRAIELDCWFSVSPAMLLSASGRRAIDAMPMERILLESDGPLAQYEGQDTLPWQTEKVVGYLAKTRNETSRNISAAIFRNFEMIATQSGPEKKLSPKR